MSGSTDPGSSRPIPVPEPVVRLALRLEREGYEAWCVGGAVRDALMGHAGLDWDLATSASPDDLRRMFRRTVPIGIEFGTVGVFDDAGQMHEVTTFRADVETDGRHAVVRFGVSLQEDLSRRDFTINAIAYSPTRRILRDPFHGRRDLEAGLVRTVGDPRRRLAEDRLRALRAIRFAARFEFDIEAATWAAIVESAPALRRLSPERVRQEIEKTLDQVARPSGAFARWRSSGAFGVLVPGMESVGDGDLAVVDCLPPAGPRGRPARRILRLAALFLPIGAAGAESAMRALRFSKSDSGAVRSLLAAWEAVGPSVEGALSDGGGGDESIRRWAAESGRTRLSGLLRLGAARVAARPVAVERSLHGRLYRRALTIAFRDPVSLPDLAVDGGDILAARIASGRDVGLSLRALLDYVLEDPARNRRDVLLDRARDFMRQRGDEQPDSGEE